MQCQCWYYRRTRAAKKEQEEKQKEEEAAQQKEETAEEEYSPPCDSNLLKYVEEVKERIQPLPTSRDQVVALAQLVYQKSC